MGPQATWTVGVITTIFVGVAVRSEVSVIVVETMEVIICFDVIVVVSEGMEVAVKVDVIPIGIVDGARVDTNVELTVAVSQPADIVETQPTACGNRNRPVKF